MRTLAAFALAALALGAAAPAGADIDFAIRQLVTAAPAPAPPAALPDAAATPQITLITGDWVDVREVLKTVAKSGGYGLQLAPDVEGQVNVHLENVTFAAALRALLEPIDLGYELQDQTLLVYRHGLVTRWFNFDYPVTQREGKGELRISGRGKSSNESGGSQDQNESHVTSSSAMAIWPEIMQALETLVFDHSRTDASAPTASTSQSLSLADGEGRSLLVSPMAGVIQATAEGRRLRLVDGYLERMRSALRRQVAIEVKILEVAMNDEERSGVDWTAVANEDGVAMEARQRTTEALGNPFFNFVISGKSVSGLLEAVSKQGTVKVISTPRITTLNNQKAVVRIVTEEVFYDAQVEPPVVTDGVSTEPVIAYSANVIPVGFVLDVTPQVGLDDVITLNVHPTVTDIIRIETSPNQDSAPVLSVRELDTVGKVRDGETLVIAGFMTEGTNDQHQGVPFLKDLPFIGRLFRRTVSTKVETEMVMLLTPVILDSERTAAWTEEAERSLGEKF
jgi:MSHA type pilus biogenesis protein MshL